MQVACRCQFNNSCSSPTLSGGISRAVQTERKLSWVLLHGHKASALMTAQTDVEAKLSPNRFSKPTLTSVTDTSDIRCTSKSEGHKTFIGCYGALRASRTSPSVNDKSFIRTHEPWSASEMGRHERFIEQALLWRYWPNPCVHNWSFRILNYSRKSQTNDSLFLLCFRGQSTQCAVIALNRFAATKSLHTQALSPSSPQQKHAILNGRLCTANWVANEACCPLIFIWFSAHFHYPVRRTCLHSPRSKAHKRYANE